MVENESDTFDYCDHIIQSIWDTRFIYKIIVSSPTS